MSNKTYDTLKTIALVMPIFITFIIAVLKIWDIPYENQIEMTLLAFETLIAGIVKIAGSIYNKKKKENK